MWPDFRIKYSKLFYTHVPLRKASRSQSFNFLIYNYYGSVVLDQSGFQIIIFVF
jgi:hypothetical protein